MTRRSVRSSSSPIIRALLLTIAVACGGAGDAPSTSPGTTGNALTVSLAPVSAGVVGTRSTSGTVGRLTCDFSWTASVVGTSDGSWNNVQWTMESAVAGPIKQTDTITAYTASTALGSGTQTFHGSWNLAWTQSGLPRYVPFSVTVAMGYTEKATGAHKTTAPIRMTCDAPPIQATTLIAGTPATNLAGLAGDSLLFKVAVPAGSSRLSVNTAGGTGQLGLYVRQGSMPTASAMDCKSEQSTSIATCQISNPAAGDWYVLITTAGGFSGVTLTAGASSVPQAPGFTLSAVPTNVTIRAGGTASVTVTANRVGGFNGAILLSAEGLPPGIAANPVSFDAGFQSVALTLNAASTLNVTSFTFTIRGHATGLFDQTLSMLGTVSTGTPPGSQVIELVASFEKTAGNWPNGYYPMAGLTEGTDGNLYGAANDGGVQPGGNSGYGTVFRVTPSSGQLTTLATLDGSTSSTGMHAHRFVRAADGTLYSMTSDGIFFKLSASGAYTRIARSQEMSGIVGALALASDGSFFGVTVSGGTQSKGSIFRVTTAGAVTTIVSFTGTNGSFPLAGMVLAPDGNFYGTTSRGGASDNGTIFRLTPAGQLTTLASMSSATGTVPASQLVVGADGALYGTAQYNGTSSQGTVFRVTTAGALTVVYGFNPVDASRQCNCAPYSPYGGLVLARDGNLYGTTWGGKTNGFSNGNGAVYRITPSGAYSIVGYMPANVGINVMDNLVQGRDGYLYGTTTDGGPTTSSGGTVFRVNINP